MKETEKLILYRGFEDGKVLEGITQAMGYFRKKDSRGGMDEEDKPEDSIQALCYACVHELIEIAASHGFEGNLWQDYLTFLLVNHENAYSTACEIRGSISGSINQLAAHDFALFQEWFGYDLGELGQSLGMPEFSILMDYNRSGRNGKVFNHRIRDQI